MPYLFFSMILHVFLSRPFQGQNLKKIYGTQKWQKTMENFRREFSEHRKISVDRLSHLTQNKTNIRNSKKILFDNTIQHILYQVPTYCSQSLLFASGSKLELGSSRVLWRGPPGLASEANMAHNGAQVPQRLLLSRSLVLLSCETS